MKRLIIGRSTDLKIYLLILIFYAIILYPLYQSIVDKCLSISLNKWEGNE